MNPVYIEIDEEGNKFYFKDRSMKILHREDGPAAESSDGYKAWYFNDERHREDGPAVEWADGDKEWWLNGKRHREDGPAVEWSNDKEWWINGVCLTEEEFEKRIVKEIALTFDEIAAKFGVDVSKLKIVK